MDPWTADRTTATRVARGSWCVGVTTVVSSGCTTTLKMTAVTCHRASPHSDLPPSSGPGFPWSLQQTRDVVAGTMTDGDVAHQKPRVVKVKVTVTDLWTAASTMVMLAVLESWCAAATTVSSSELTITRRTTAVSDQPGETAPQSGKPSSWCRSSAQSLLIIFTVGFTLIGSVSSPSSTRELYTGSAPGRTLSIVTTSPGVPQPPPGQGSPCPDTGETVLQPALWRRHHQ